MNNTKLDWTPNCDCILGTIFVKNERKNRIIEITDALRPTPTSSINDFFTTL